MNRVLALPSWAWWITAALAAYRATRLVTTDEVSRPAREAIARRSTWLGYLVTCDWCVGFWISVALVVALWRVPTPTAYVALALAWSALVGWLSERMN